MNGMGEKLGIDGGIIRFASRMVAGISAFRAIVGFCVFQVAYYLAYRYAMSFSHASASPFWFPDSVLLCALLLNPPKRWWIFILAPLPIRLLVVVPPGVPAWFLPTTFAIDVIKNVLAAMALRRFVKNPLRLETVREFGVYCLFAVLLAPAMAAFAGAATRYALGNKYWTAWEQWFMGNVLTHLVVTPALLYLVFGKWWRAGLPSPKRCMEGVLVTVGLIVTGWVAFHSESVRIGLAEWRFYAPVPFLFWAVIRFGMLGASGAITITATLAVKAALDKHGMFSGLSPNATALALQHFLLLRAAPLYLVAILIEQKERADRSLRESEARFRNMADTAPVMIWMSGTDKRCTYFNQRWLDFTGRPHEAEVGDGWLDRVHPEDVGSRIIGHPEAFDCQRPFTVEYRLLRHDGQYRWIRAQSVPRVMSGEFLGYVGLCVDVTDQKHLEETNRNLAHLQRMAAMGELTAMIAHEVNQPLGAILSNADAAEILLESPKPPLGEIREILAAIRKNDLRADEVIRRIRALVRKREMQMEPFDLTDTVSDAVRLVSGDAARRGVEIQTDAEGGLPLAFGDRAYLQQVLLNLMFNGMDAMKEMPEPARKLMVLTRSDGNGCVNVVVKDHGPGIAPERLHRIFESFFTTKPEGMGLGLSIAHTIIEAHQGRIWAENNPRGGATVQFTVPIAKV